MGLIRLQASNYFAQVFVLALGVLQSGQQVIVPILVVSAFDLFQTIVQVTFVDRLIQGFFKALVRHVFRLVMRQCLDFL